MQTYPNRNAEVAMVYGGETPYIGAILCGTPIDIVPERTVGPQRPGKLKPSPPPQFTGFFGGSAPLPPIRTAAAIFSAAAADLPVIGGQGGLGALEFPSVSALADIAASVHRTADMLRLVDIFDISRPVDRGV